MPTPALQGEASSTAPVDTKLCLKLCLTGFWRIVTVQARLRLNSVKSVLRKCLEMGANTTDSDPRLQLPLREELLSVFNPPKSTFSLKRRGLKTDPRLQSHHFITVVTPEP